MGKKGSWFSAVKRVFTSNSKEKPVNERDKKSCKVNKGKGLGRLKHGSFIPLFREPSSIEKILEEVDQQNLFIGHAHQSQAPPPSSPSSFSSGRPASPPAPPPPPPPPPPRLTSPQSPRVVASPPRPRGVVHPQTKIGQTSEPTLQQQHLSATRIQAVYRGHMARRKVRGLTGLVRLQGVVRGQHVKRQTVNAMKQMQLLVRVQTQIKSQRIQMLENQSLLKQQPNTNPHKQSEMGDDFWDDSLMTKEEREARLNRKAEAVIKRERAMAYAYSQQLWKATPTSGKTSVMGGNPYPWWWNWLERQLPSQTRTPQKKDEQFATPPDQKLNHKQQLDRPRSTAASRSTTPPNRMMKARGGRGSSPLPSSSYPIKDDDSLMSCPAFSVPNYMSPTVSARAKARPRSNPRDRMAAPSTPGSDSSKRRFSFPFAPNTSNKHKSPGSVGDFSIDSANSVPASVGRKPFNRFV